MTPFFKAAGAALAVAAAAAAAQGPARVITVGGAVTEIVFALGAGENCDDPFGIADPPRSACLGDVHA